MKIHEEIAKRFFGRLWEDTAGYLRLYDFLKLKARSLASAGAVKKLTVPEFWYGILGDRFSGSSVKYQPVRDGDLVQFKSGFMTEWAPKLPGQIWTTEGATDLKAGLREVEGRRIYGDGLYTILNPYGKQRVINAGYGSVRLARATTDSDYFGYLSLTDEANWMCDYGIPIIASRPVFESFQKRAVSGAPAITHLEGVVRMGTDAPLSQYIPRAIGAELSEASQESLRLRPGLPRCYIHVTSPLAVKFLINDSHPTATAWTMYENRPGHPAGAYAFSYCLFNPNASGQSEEAAAFLNHYVRDHNGTRIITDYDAVVPRLAAEIPITKSAVGRSKAAVKKLGKGIDRWVKSTIDDVRRGSY